MPHISSLREILVAFCSEGLRGIRFAFADSTSSKWVGDTASPGIAFGTLEIHKGSDCQYLLVGLDYLKIVSLGLSKVNESPSYDLIDSLGSQSSLWVPCAPNKKGVEISTLLPLSKSSRAFEPLMNIDFGGPKGLFLGSVRRFTCYMTKDNCPLVEIEIFHSDGRSVMCGTRTDCELSLFLDGAKGERIDKVGIYEDNPYNRDIGRIDNTETGPIISLNGLYISTTLGRTASFAPIRTRLAGQTTSLPYLPPNHTITGLIAIRDVSKIDSRESGFNLSYVTNNLRTLREKRSWIMGATMPQTSSFNTTKSSVSSQSQAGFLPIKPMPRSEMFERSRRQEAFKEDPEAPIAYPA